jgi:autotransporter-associated beta strand protein
LYNSSFNGVVTGTSSSSIELNDKLTLTGSDVDLSGFAGDVNIATGWLALDDSSLLSSGTVTGGVDARFEALHAIDQTFLDIADTSNFDGTILVDADSANALDFSGFSNTVELGAFGGTIDSPDANLSGNITPHSGGLLLGFEGVLEISGVISGTNGLTVKSGTHILSGNNTYTGGTTVETGAELILMSGSSLGGGGLTVQTDGYVGAGYAINQAFLNQAGSASAFTVGVNADSANNLDLDVLNANSRLGTNASFSNPVTLGGTITEHSSSGYRFGEGGGFMTVSSNLNGSTLDVLGLNLTLTGDNTISGNVAIEDARLTLSGTNTVSGAYSLVLGALNISTASNLGNSNTISMAGSTLSVSSTTTLSNNIETTSDASLRSALGQTLTLDGIISGSGGMSFDSNGGIIHVNGSNTYAGGGGGTGIFSGTVVMGNANAFGTSGSMYFGSGSTLDLNSNALSLSSVGSDNGFAVNNGTLTIDVSGSDSVGSMAGSAGLVKTGAGTLSLGTSTFSGGASIVSGSLVAEGDVGSGNVALGNAQLSGGSSAVVSNSVSIGGTGSASLGGNLELSGGITGSQDVTVNSGASVTLSGNSSHSGLIQVDGGLNISADINSDIALEGILSGTGSTTGSLLVSNGGVLQPGNSVGTLTVGDTTFGAGGFYDFEIDDTSMSDLLIVDGTLEFTSTSVDPFTINLISLSGGNAGFMSGFEASQNNSWTMVQADSITGFSQGIISLNLDGFANSLGVGSMNVQQSGNNLVLNYVSNVVAIPETSTILMVLGFFVTFVLFGRSRKNGTHVR